MIYREERNRVFVFRRFETTYVVDTYLVAIAPVRFGFMDRREGLYERSKEDTTAPGNDLVTQRCEG